MKTCARCNTKKPLVEFRKSSASPDGHQYSCKLCVSARIKSSYEEKYKEAAVTRSSARLINHREFLNGLKASGCVCCGERYVGCLDFHHLDPTKKDFMISARYGRSKESLQREIDKCIVVCKNCHTKIHYGVIPEPIKEG